MSIDADDRFHIIVLGSHAPSLISFRGSMIRSMVARGWRVTAVAPDIDAQAAGVLAGLGAEPLSVNVVRKSMNPLSSLAYWASLVRLFRIRKPDVVFTYTIKPVIWGGLAARVSGVPRVVAMIPGLGYAFTPSERPSLKHVIANRAARLLYRLALPQADHVLFQNPDDSNLFQRLRFTPSPDRVGVTAGSGVDLAHFAPSPPPERPSFLMLARLLKAKGIAEYATAAIELKARHPHVDFRLAGPFDPGPDGVTRESLNRWTARGLSYLGPLSDVRPAIADAAVYVLPSYYREGTPRSVLEALAVGRAVITTDAPGCRETVTDNENGFLVPPRDAKALENAMERFILDPTLAPRMGEASRSLACKKYDVHKVNAQILAAISPEDEPQGCKR